MNEPQSTPPRTEAGEVPQWISDLEKACTDAYESVKAARSAGNKHMEGYHSGRAQVLAAWVESAKISRICAPASPRSDAEFSKGK